MGKLPSTSELSRSGVQVFSKGKEKLQEPPASVAEALSLFERAGKESTENEGNHPLVATGPGLPALPKKVVDKILANDYVDFSESVSAAGSGRAGDCCPSSRFDANQKDHSRPGNVDTVLWPICSSPPEAEA